MKVIPYLFEGGMALYSGNVFGQDTINVKETFYPESQEIRTSYFIKGPNGQIVEHISALKSIFNSEEYHLKNKQVYDDLNEYFSKNFKGKDSIKINNIHFDNHNCTINAEKQKDSSRFNIELIKDYKGVQIIYFDGNCDGLKPNTGDRLIHFLGKGRKFVEEWDKGEQFMALEQYLGFIKNFMHKKGWKNY